MKSTKQLTGIVVLNYNNIQDTKTCVNSILKHSNNFKLLVVDNGSNDEVVNTIEKYLYSLSNDFKSIHSEEGIGESGLTKINLLKLPYNLGYAQGNNKGIEQMVQDKFIENILILNSDIILTQNILPELLKKLNSKKGLGIVSPLLFKKDGKTIDHICARKNPSLSHFLTEYALLYQNIFGILSFLNNKLYILKANPSLVRDSLIEIEVPSGSCMLISKKFFQEIGFFDPNTFLFFEENILYEKINRLGLKNYVVPSVSCIHIGASSRRGLPSMFSARHSINSMFYYIRKYKNPSWLYLTLLKTATSIFLVKLKIKDNLDANKKNVIA